MDSVSAYLGVDITVKVNFSSCFVVVFLEFLFFLFAAHPGGCWMRLFY
jgi:hypothetical protein